MTFLNPMIYMIAEKGQLLPLSLTMYGKITISKCHISCLIYAKLGEVTLDIDTSKLGC